MSLLSYTISGDAIKLDMTKERPVWILSSYAPGKDPPVQLIDKKDVSPEELRVRAYELAAQGNFQLFVGSNTIHLVWEPSLTLRSTGNRVRPADCCSRDANQ